MTGNMEKLSRRERERLQHKDEILSAALKLFSEKGFHNVSMQEIATEAEFATGTLYNFFPSKEALFEELKKDCATKIIEFLGSILDEPGTEIERLKKYFRSQSELIERHGQFIRLYVAEFGLKGCRAPRDPDEEEIGRVLDEKMEKILQDGIRKRVLRRVDPTITTKAIHSLMQLLVFETVGNTNRKEVVEIFQKVEHLFLDGLLIPRGAENE